MVSVKLRSGVRLASLSHGMVFGEMALIEEVRSADVWADTLVQCLELSIDQFEIFSERHRRSGQRIRRKSRGAARQAADSGQCQGRRA